MIRSNQPCRADELLVVVVEHEDAGAAPQTDAQQSPDHRPQNPPPRFVALGERPTEAFDHREHVLDAGQPCRQRTDNVLLCAVGENEIGAFRPKDVRKSGDFAHGAQRIEGGLVQPDRAIIRAEAEEGRGKFVVGRAANEDAMARRDDFADEPAAKLLGIRIADDGHGSAVHRD